MTVDTIDARNKKIKVLEAQRADDAATIKGLSEKLVEREQLWVEAMDEAQTQKDRAEATEAEVRRLRAKLAEESGLLDWLEELQAEVEQLCGDHQEAERAAQVNLERAEAAEARIDELEQALDEAEALIIRQRDERKDKLARADRLVEAPRAMVEEREDYWGVERGELMRNDPEANAYRSDSPPQGEAVHPDTEREPSEVEMLRALDRSATRKRLDLESEIRELRKAEEWVRLIRMLASEYSGNMKLSKAIDRADAAFRSFSPQPADLCPRHDLGHEFSPCTGTPDDPCLAVPSPQPTATHFACPQRHLDYEREGE